MLKTRKRWISLLVTLAMLVTFAVPFVGPAAAATGIKALTVPNVSDGKWQDVGDVVIEVDGGALTGGNAVTLRLPEDFKFVDDVGNADVYYDVSQAVYQIIDKNRDSNTGDTVQSDGKTLVTPGTGNYVAVSIQTPSSYAGNFNELQADQLEVSLLDENEIQIRLKDDATFIPDRDEAILKIVINKVWIKDGASGDVNLSVEKPSDSAFPAGDVVIARVPGELCELSVPSVDTFSDTKVVKFRVKETTTGSLTEDKESLKLSLPDGFEWATLDTGDYDGYKLIIGDYVAYKKIWGDDITISSVTANSDKDELTFEVTKESSSKAAYYEFIAKITVADETKAKTGDVVVSVSGESDVNVDSLTIAKYGEYNAKIEADNPNTEIFSGMLDQDVSDIKITEDVAGSLTKDRTIILTLPDNAKWTKVDTNGDSDSGCEISFVGAVGDDGRSIKYKVTKASTSDAAELTLEDFQVAVEPGFTGDLKVTVSGTAGLEGDIVIAKVKAPVTATVTSKADVKIGLANQSINDVTITESKAGALKDDAYIKLDLPSGVSFDNVPTVEVTEGDLSIDSSTIKRAADGSEANNQLWFKISNDSTKASTIKISNIRLKLDRTVPEGDIILKVKGEAAAETADAVAIDDYFESASWTDNKLTVKFGSKEAYTIEKDDLLFPNSTTAAEVAIANCITPAPGEQKGTAVFKIGETKYTVNGQEYTMDVAPIAEAGRTYLPARFVANAMGVPDSNIMWDQASKTVTVIRGERFVQMKVGSKQILVNGITLNMDVAPKVVPGRVLIPFRFLAQALGAEVVWDPADPNTIILNF